MVNRQRWVRDSCEGAEDESRNTQTMLLLAEVGRHSPTPAIHGSANLPNPAVWIFIGKPHGALGGWAIAFVDKCKSVFLASAIDG